ncbi:hypothetical protein GGI09_000342 [Coemansia sp. S100]|nr:hypothetical protein GGI09_000342 [Coemansia sp. S100]
MTVKPSATHYADELAISSMFLFAGVLHLKGVYKEKTGAALQQKQLAKELRARDLDAIQAEARYRREQAAIANDEDKEAAQAAYMARIATAIGPLTKNWCKHENRLRRRQVFNAWRSYQHPNQDAPQQQQQQRKAYQCCPLRTLFIPGHIHIDSMILHSHFLLNVEGLTSGTNPRDLWAEVVILKSKTSRDREGLTFHGTGMYLGGFIPRL